MSDNPFNRIYRKKHFYKVTWFRSEKLLSQVPWLKSAEHDFCMVGYRQPTKEEAEKFIGSTMYDRLFDKVSCVQEISKEQALCDFEMSNWRSQKEFGADDRAQRNLPLAKQINIAKDQSVRNRISKDINSRESEHSR